MAGEVCVEYTICGKNAPFAGNRSVVLSFDMTMVTKDIEQNGVVTGRIIKHYAHPYMFGRMQVNGYIKAMKQYLPASHPKIIPSHVGMELAAQFSRWLNREEVPPVYLVGTKRHPGDYSEGNGPSIEEVKELDITYDLDAGVVDDGGSNGNARADESRGVYDPTVWDTIKQSQG